MNIVMPGRAVAFAARQREQADKLRAQHGVEPQPWYRITNATGDEAEILLYDEIGGWWGTTAEEFIDELKQVTAPNLLVRVNSPGGSVFEGIAIANALRSHSANVTVQVDGLAASIASVITMAADRVVMSPQTMLMIHDAAGVCYGNASDMQEMGELLDLISDNIADAYAARAGGTRAEWRDRMRAETWYLPGDAVEAGLADEAIAVPQSGEPVAEPEEEEVEPEPEMRRQFDLAAYGYAGPNRPEAPKPAPPAAAEAEQVTLTFNVGSTIGEQFAELLRASVAQRVEPVKDGPAPQAAEDTTPAEPEPEPEAPAEDTWADTIAHLTRDDADDWSALVSHLTSNSASSPAAAEA
ncbi:head maturation protease, ClpP-related [Streptomyces sp. NPDC001139]